MAGYIDPFRRGSRLADVLAARLQPVPSFTPAPDSGAAVEFVQSPTTPGNPLPQEATGMPEKVPVNATPIYLLRSRQLFARTIGQGAA